MSPALAGRFFLPLVLPGKQCIYISLNLPVYPICFPYLLSIPLLSVSVPLFLLFPYVHLHHFSRVHTYVLIHDTYFSLSDLLHSLWPCLGPLASCSFSRLSNIPSCVCPTSLLQGIFPTQGSNPGLLHCRQSFYCLNHPGIPQGYSEWIQKYTPACAIYRKKINQKRETELRNSLQSVGLCKFPPGLCVCGLNHKLRFLLLPGTLDLWPPPLFMRGHLLLYDHIGTLLGQWSQWVRISFSWTDTAWFSDYGKGETVCIFSKWLDLILTRRWHFLVYCLYSSQTFRGHMHFQGH